MSQADDRCFSLEVAVKLTLQNLRLYIPGDAVPTRLSSFRLLAMVSPQLDTRRKLLI
jgi:hypothetical protein